MKRISYKHIYERTKQLLFKPDTAWSGVMDETENPAELFRNYLLPVTLITSLFVLLLSLLTHNVLQAVGLAFINLLSDVCGAWFAYLITREYLCNKLSYPDCNALNLTVYSAAIFIVFHGIGAALGNVFIGQLFTLLSFIFIRTLYSGIGLLPDMQPAQKTNILVITSLSIICIPIIISQILMIVFRISAINV